MQADRRSSAIRSSARSTERGRRERLPRAHPRREPPDSWRPETASVNPHRPAFHLVPRSADGAATQLRGQGEHGREALGGYRPGSRRHPRCRHLAHAPHHCSARREPAVRARLTGLRRADGPGRLTPRCARPALRPRRARPGGRACRPGQRARPGPIPFPSLPVTVATRGGDTAGPLSACGAGRGGAPQGDVSGDGGDYGPPQEQGDHPTLPPHRAPTRFVKPGRAVTTARTAREASLSLSFSLSLFLSLSFSLSLALSLSLSLSCSLSLSLLLLPIPLSPPLSL